MSFDTECDRELTELWADVATSAVSADYEKARKETIESSLASIVLKELPDGTFIFPRI